MVDGDDSFLSSYCVLCSRKVRLHKVNKVYGLLAHLPPVRPTHRKGFRYDAVGSNAYVVAPLIQANKLDLYHINNQQMEVRYPPNYSSLPQSQIAGCTRIKAI